MQDRVITVSPRHKSNVSFYRFYLMGRSPIRLPLSSGCCGDLPQMKERTMKRKQLWNASTPALTPDCSTPKCGTSFNPTPDIHVEESLFRMYIQERDKATRFLKERDAARAEAAWLQTNLDRRKRWSRIKRLTQLTPKESQ